MLNYQNGTIQDLQKMLKDGQFAASPENENQVAINISGVLNEQLPGNKTGKAPDHLLRLFAYNDIMKKVGGSYFTDNYIQPETIAEAEKAYVVSPVSSLIVLETKADYERFDIKASKNSLENASMKSSGAVPEPYEWMLILLTFSVAIYLMYKPGFLKQA